MGTKHSRRSDPKYFAGDVVVFWRVVDYDHWAPKWGHYYRVACVHCGTQKVIAQNEMERLIGSEQTHCSACHLHALATIGGREQTKAEWIREFMAQGRSYDAARRRFRYLAGDCTLPSASWPLFSDVERVAFCRPWAPRSETLSVLRKSESATRTQDFPVRRSESRSGSESSTHSAAA